MYTYAQNWLQERNLPQTETSRELPREVVIYLLVTWAVHPDRIPVEVAAFLATEVLGHCVGDSTH